MQRKSRNLLLSRILCMMLIVAMALFTIGCNKEKRETPKSGPEANVTASTEVTQEGAEGTGGQTDDAATDVKDLGEGKLTFRFSVVDKDGNETKFLIHTDKETVGDALLEHALIEGDEGEFGLYVKKVNGILADYDVDQTYWGFYVDDAYAMSGVDTTNIEEGRNYSFKVSK